MSWYVWYACATFGMRDETSHTYIHTHSHTTHTHHRDVRFRTRQAQISAAALYCLCRSSSTVHCTYPAMQLNPEAGIRSSCLGRLDPGQEISN